MKAIDIHIRDPFVLFEEGVYYLYGTRARDFGRKTGGFDVYTSTDLENWSEPQECFDSETYGLNLDANWAPEVHRYKGVYYLFATFTRQSNGLRATFIMRSESPKGPFVPHSRGEVTPKDWECLDGTLYVDRDGLPYLVFCHEHTQIADGTICYVRLNDDLTEPVGEVTTIFAASTCPYTSKRADGHCITDGPFLYRTNAGELLMIWSTSVNGKYGECLVRFKDGELGCDIEHLPPVGSEDGGHGMIFSDGEKLRLTWHFPNVLGSERPRFFEIEDRGDSIAIK